MGQGSGGFVVKIMVGLTLEFRGYDYVLEVYA